MGQAEYGLNANNLADAALPVSPARRLRSRRRFDDASVCTWLFPVHIHGDQPAAASGGEPGFGAACQTCLGTSRTCAAFPFQPLLTADVDTGQSN